MLARLCRSVEFLEDRQHITNYEELESIRTGQGLRFVRAGLLRRALQIAPMASPLGKICIFTRYRSSQHGQLLLHVSAAPVTMASALLSSLDSVDFHELRRPSFHTSQDISF